MQNQILSFTLCFFLGHTAQPVEIAPLNILFHLLSETNEVSYSSSDICSTITITNGSGLVMCGGDSGSVISSCSECGDTNQARLLNGYSVTTNIVNSSNCFSLTLAGGHQPSVNISITLSPGGPGCPRPAPIQVTLYVNQTASFQVVTDINGCCQLVHL